MLREAPQLLVPDPSASSFSSKEKIETLMKAFLEMSPEDQAGYLNLHRQRQTALKMAKWSDEMKMAAQNARRIVAEMSIPNISQDLAFKVWVIYLTHRKPGGAVFTKSSWVNHACQPNTHCLWNEETKTREYRAMRKIKEGEEITISYLGGLLTRAERRAFLKTELDFDCNCVACDMTEEQANKEAQYIGKYKDEQKKIDDINNLLDSGAVNDVAFKHSFLKRKMECLKEMYRQARKLKTMIPRETLLDDVLRVAIRLSCDGAMVAKRLGMRSEETEWKKDLAMFAKIGLEVASTIYGEEYSETKDWRVTAINARSDLN